MTTTPTPVEPFDQPVVVDGKPALALDAKHPPAPKPARKRKEAPSARDVALRDVRDAGRQVRAAQDAVRTANERLVKVLRVADALDDVNRTQLIDEAGLSRATVYNALKPAALTDEQRQAAASLAADMTSS